MDEQREPDRKNVDQLLKEWGIDLDAFEARARRAAADAHGDYREVLGELREKLGQTRVKLQELRTAAGPASAEVRSGFARALGELAKALDRAASRMRDKGDGGGEPPGAAGS